MNNDPSYGVNPYAAPHAPFPFQPQPQPPGVGPDGVSLVVGLFTPRHVALATFLGTPLGGAIVMAINELRRSKTHNAALAVLGGVAGTGLLFLLGFVLPDGVPSFPIGLLSLFAMGAIARSKQGPLVNRHLAAGGKQASGWLAAGIGILALIAAFVPLVAFLVVVELLRGH